jgi:chromosome partitioning protein
MIVLIGGEKGGTGKTTIAVNLACHAAADGADLMFVDTDVQRSAATFFSIRDDDLPRIPCVEKRGKGLAQELLELNKSSKYELVVVDAGGRDTLELRYALGVSDEAYIPVQPAQADLWTLDKMSELVEEAAAFNANLAAHVIFNRCSTNVKNTDAQEARELLQEYDNLTPLDTQLHERVIFQRIFRTGSCASEYDSNDAGSKEMYQLYQEIFYGEE